jgi:predicted transcriptional regulator
MQVIERNDEIFAAIREMVQTSEPERPEGVFTTAELQERLGVGRVLAQRAIKQLLADGQVERTRLQIVDMTGRQTSTFAYKWVGDGE